MDISSPTTYTTKTIKPCTQILSLQLTHIYVIALNDGGTYVSGLNSAKNSGSISKYILSHGRA